jgi:beta-galactosidase
MKMNRRTLLKAATAATLAPTLPSLAATEPQPHGLPYPENGTLIPDEGWHLWVDDKAPWQNDDIFLPEDISWIGEGENAHLCGKGTPLPVNTPTGGWSTLTPTAGKEVVLPTTVEQHFWGKYGSRPYTPEEYRYAADDKHGTQPISAPADDDVPQNGAYFGVSWFYRAITIPAEMRGKRIFLHLRGAHLRAEVYLNGHLCGYSIMEELPFEADLTHAAAFSNNDAAAENLLAIRTTNPFGRFDWVDGLNAKWGKLSLYRSHGFGGMDRGLTISAHKGIRIKSAWALNTPDPTTLNVFLEIEGAPHAIDKVSTRFGYQLQHVATREIESIHVVPVNGTWLPSKISEGRKVLTGQIKFPRARLWTLDDPNLYELSVLIENGGDTILAGTGMRVGFRSFTVDGLGSNALFRLNGRRIRIYTAISWGFWGLNGMFPVPELAKKEVTAAKALGLNCLNFHRNLAKEDVLRQHDQLGLLRYMEPGAGKLAIGKLPAHTDPAMHSVVMEKPTSEADLFAQRYMFVRCVEMVKAYRSHPSVIEYCLQNEIGADLNNPATLAILKAMHDEDPSRCVVLNDGFVARGAAQAWYEPWSYELQPTTSPTSHLASSISPLAEGKLHRSDEEKWGGWWNNHQGAGDQWYDEFYKSPTDYTYDVNFRDVLTEYGEMEGCARPDIHPLMVHQITDTYKKYGGDSYDLTDHEQIIAAYEKFLTKWNFRQAFPTSESLFLALGRTCYDSWQNYMENARINDALDFAAISGWESTAIENHSGIVDNLRNHKSDPELIRGSLLPIRPIAKQRSLIIEQGQPATFDLFLANDTPEPATGKLTFTMITPSGKKLDLITLPAPQHVTDQFSYLLKEAFTTPPLKEEGLYRFKFSISSSPLATQTKELWATSVPKQTEECKAMYVAVSGITPALRKQLAELGEKDGCFEVVDFKQGGAYKLIISSGLTSHTTADQNSGETTGESMPAPRPGIIVKPGHKPEPGELPQTTQLGHLQHGILEAVQAGTPLLAIPQADTLSDGVAQQLAAAGAFTYHGAVGDLRAPWMGNWYFVRDHPLFAGMPVNQAMGIFYQVKGRQANGLLVEKHPEGADIEIVAAYSRDHSRTIGAGIFTTRLNNTKILYHRIPDMHPVMQQRFLANALHWLTT